MDENRVLIVLGEMEDKGRREGKNQVLKNFFKTLFTSNRQHRSSLLKVSHHDSFSGGRAV